MSSQPVFYLVPKFPSKTEEIQSHPLCVGEYTVGRNGATIRLHSVDVSRLQAKLNVDTKGVTVTDLGSTNGTWVGAVKLTEGQSKRVSPGQEIRFGEYPLILSTTPELPVDSQTNTHETKRSIVPPQTPLSPAQNRVFLAAINGKGLTEKEMAAKLYLSINTIHRHMQDIYIAYEVGSRQELICKALGVPESE